MRDHRPLTLQWEGTFVELCIDRLPPALQVQVEALAGGATQEARTWWYENTAFLKTHFQADNWWSVDGLDHAMGLHFADRSQLDSRLGTIRVAVDGQLTLLDPQRLQLNFYAPETMEGLQPGELAVCHGTRREAVLHLQAAIDQPFDPSWITLSFVRYPGYGYILIDLDYDGQDEVRFDWGPATYLEPRFLGKAHFDPSADGELD